VTSSQRIRTGRLRRTPPWLMRDWSRRKWRPEGGVAGWPTCDLEVAKDSVNAAEAEAGRGPIDLKKDFLRPWQEREATHVLNIQAAKYAKTKITSCSA